VYRGGGITFFEVRKEKFDEVVDWFTCHNEKHDSTRTFQKFTQLLN